MYLFFKIFGILYFFEIFKGCIGVKKMYFTGALGVVYISGIIAMIVNSVNSQPFSYFVLLLSWYPMIYITAKFPILLTLKVITTQLHVQCFTNTWVRKVLEQNLWWRKWFNSIYITRNKLNIGRNFCFIIFYRRKLYPGMHDTRKYLQYNFWLQ